MMLKCLNCAATYASKLGRCPDCGTHAPRTAGSGQSKESYALGYPQCDWQSDGKRCRYPGTLTSSTLAESSTLWFCFGHFECHNPVMGADIVQASQDYQHVPTGDRSNVQAAAAAFCEQHGLKTQAEMRTYIRSKLPTIAKD